MTEQELRERIGAPLEEQLALAKGATVEDAFLDSEPRAAGYASIAVEVEQLGAQADRGVTAHFVETEPGKYASRGAYAADLAANPNGHPDSAADARLAGCNAHVARLKAAGVQPRSAQRAHGDRLSSADCEAWGLPEGTPRSALPASYAEWLAGGRAEDPPAEARSRIHDAIPDRGHIDDLPAAQREDYAAQVAVALPDAAHRGSWDEWRVATDTLTNHGEGMAEHRTDTTSDPEQLAEESPRKAEAADAVAWAHQAVAELPAPTATGRAGPASQSEATSQAGEVLGDE